MKKLTAIFTALVLCCAPVSAQDRYETPIALCCEKDVFAVDMIFGITEEVTVSSVSLNIKNALSDWNVKDGKLYVSVASADALSLPVVLGRVYTNAPCTLIPQSITVNGSDRENIYTSHLGVTIPGTPPSCDRGGLTDGEKCGRCNVITREQETVPATGPQISAAADEHGTLTVGGIISDTPVASGRVWLAVYRADGRLIAIKSLTGENQSDFELEIPGCTKGTEVKIFRWQKDAVKPEKDVITATVK
ncbi:MAG: hypothetical protein IKV89_04670 [Clostridia bacterium]|nr:hypothetical protein [Clostridia bacterium]